ncbi:hypothetical protein GTY75_31095 [Streptomyces sp. SID8381]|uniref:hypothetical protein n=1 Tax=unclassified Streptomyces TaxID=2593676 RepID=UPI001319C37C|nr:MULTISPECIES: hypothetical protein [unclassified Streptomyces]MYX31019.1 hypothetical protein [Streptomyces sp. SID8381]
MTGTEEKVAMQASARERSHAEIERVWPRDGQIRVIGTVIIDGKPDAAPVDRPWKLCLTSRERPDIPVPTGVKRLADRLVRTVNPTSRPTPRRLYFPVVRKGDSFEAVVAVRDLAVWDALPREHWDMHVVTTRGGRKLILRVGGHLDDMPGKKQIVKYPEQYKDGVAVLPYFTDGDDLSIRCARRDDAKRSAT